MGLGLAIDYSLFIVSRYREELGASGPADALRRTLATAGRTVDLQRAHGRRRAARADRLPAALPVLDGHRRRVRGADRRASSPSPRCPRSSSSSAPASGPSGARHGFWYRLSHAVMRRPGLVAVDDRGRCCCSPGCPCSASSSPASTRPRCPRVRRRGRSTPRCGRSSRPRRRRRSSCPRERRPLPPTCAGSPGSQSVGEPRDAGAAARARRRARGAGARRPQPGGGARDPRPGARRRSASPARRRTFVDQQEALLGHLPVALAILALTTFSLLFVMTGSVVLPLKALLMNVLSLSAAFGLLVVIFQDGRFEGLLDYTSQGALESTQPVLLFAVAFALSTDYGVFLLTRIKEARDSGARRTRGGRRRAAADRPDRHRGGAPALGRARRVRHLRDHLHQAGRARDGVRGAHRRDDHPRPARARR